MAPERYNTACAGSLFDGGCCLGRAGVPAILIALVLAAIHTRKLWHVPASWARPMHVLVRRNSGSFLHPHEQRAAQIALDGASGGATAPQQASEAQQRLLEMFEYAASSMYSEVRHTFLYL